MVATAHENANIMELTMEKMPPYGAQLVEAVNRLGLCRPVLSERLAA
jgi:hypothetical protein